MIWYLNSLTAFKTIDFSLDVLFLFYLDKVWCTMISGIGIVQNLNSEFLLLTLFYQTNTHIIDSDFTRIVSVVQHNSMYCLKHECISWNSHI